MTTQIKITQLVDIGANLTATTLLPVVNMTGVPTTQKTNLGNLGNVILQGAGTTWKPAALANLAYSVANAAQPNITSVGTLTTLTVSGNTNLGAVANVRITGGTNGQVLSTDGAGNLTWATNGSGGISIPNLPAFRVYGNGVTNVSTTTNTNGVLNGNNWAVDYNQGSYLNSTTGTFTAPAAGLYQINLQMRIANNTAPTAQAIVVKNRASTNVTQVMWESAANATINHFGTSTVAKLAAGDTLNLVVSVGNLTFDVNDNWSVAFLG